MTSAQLSVVLVAPRGMRSIERTMACLREQTVSEHLEVLVAAPSARDIDVEFLARGRLAALRVVEVGDPVGSRGEAAASAVRAAACSLVAFVEDHSFPHRGWAEAFLNAHRTGEWAAVGPLVYSANIGGALGTANFALTYAALSYPQAAGPRELLAFHNASYRRECLLSYGDALGEMLEWEHELQDDLRARGYVLYLCPEAKIDHLNVSGFVSTIRMHLIRGRLFGASRWKREDWPVWKRALYVVGAPLFPLMLYRHVAPHLRLWAPAGGQRLRLLPAIAFVLTWSALGEAIGYIAGAGNAMDAYQDFELYRRNHLSERDRRLFNMEGAD